MVCCCCNKSLSRLAILNCVAASAKFCRLIDSVALSIALDVAVVAERKLDVSNLSLNFWVALAMRSFCRLSSQSSTVVLFMMM